MLLYDGVFESSSNQKLKYKKKINNTYTSVQK